MSARISESREARVIGLVEEALDELARSNVPLSSVLDKATRVARLRDDYENLVWLQMEARSAGDEEAKNRAVSEALAKIPEERYRLLHRLAVEEYMRERTLDMKDKDAIAGMSVREMEARLESLSLVDEGAPPEGMHPLDLYYARKESLEIKSQAWASAAQLRELLARIRNRVHDYLSRVENQLLLDEAVSDIFEQNRKYIDLRLEHVAPKAVGQLLAAYRRSAESSTEARSQALTSCRRALKTVADALYPATGATAVGGDGRERVMSDDRFLSRLMQFVYERGRGHSAAELLAAQIGEVGGKLEALNDLASKGVHARVSEFEMKQCVIQTYLTLGDILRLAENKHDNGDPD